MASHDLLPCPFCGGPGEARPAPGNSFTIGCRDQRSYYCKAINWPALKAGVEAWNARAAETELATAIRPFARVAKAFDYWIAEAMPSFSYPVDGTDTSLAAEDCPEAVGALEEADFRRAAQALKKHEVRRC